MEAISRKKEVDEMKTLTKEIGALQVTLVAETGSITDYAGESWTQIAGTNTFFSETYFDLAGMSMEDKTLFFTGAATQNTNPPISVPARAGNRVQIMDLMTSKPMSETDLSLASVYGNTTQTPLTFDQTVYMRNRHFNTDLDNEAAGLMILLADEQLGSLEPSASDRIYVYRFISIIGLDGSYNFFPVRFILRAEAKEEPEYEYLMRLKRSYELQNEPDRD